MYIIHFNGQQLDAYPQHDPHLAIPSARWRDIPTRHQAWLSGPAARVSDHIASIWR